MEKMKILLILMILTFIGITPLIEPSYSTHTLKIPDINVDEEINNETIDKGVLIDPKENIPSKDSIVLFGHRSTHGSPFLNLNELKKGDKIILEWSDKEKFNYTVTNTEILPENSDLDIKDNNTIYLITCDPVGSTKNRLIVTGTLQG